MDILNILLDKVAIVTGAGQGVGLGIALALAVEGATLAITGRNEDKLHAAAELIRAQGAPDVLIVAGDARSRSDAQHAVHATVAKFGRLDVLVNNAQSTVTGVPFENFDDPTIAMILESGLLGTLYFMQASFPHMKERGGSIINLGSAVGIHGAFGMSVYGANKEAIRGLSRSVAREWGRYDIRVNVICPAALSPAAQKFLESQPEAASKLSEHIPLGRLGDVHHDIGPVAVFLASNESRYITGQTLNADGGQVML